MYRGIAFDLDGTLVETSSEYRYSITRQTLDVFRVTATIADIDRFWFESDKDGIIRACFNLEPDSFWPVYRRRDTGEARIPYTTVYPEVINFLTDIKRAGYKIGIVTSAPDYIALPEIDLIGRDYFDSVILAKRSFGIQPKPHPMGLEKCLRELGVNPADAVYVGNGREDVLMAQTAKVYDVLINRGENIALEGLNPTLVISSLDQLREMLGNRNLF